MEKNIRLEQFADGEIAELETEHEGEPASLIVFREGQTLRAWLNVCPHAGRRLDYAPGQFLRTPAGLLMCAVHGATFSLANGECVGGPCVGASLTQVVLKTTEDGSTRSVPAPPRPAD